MSQMLFLNVTSVAICYGCFNGNHFGKTSGTKRLFENLAQCALEEFIIRLKAEFLNVPTNMNNIKTSRTEANNYQSKQYFSQFIIFTYPSMTLVVMNNSFTLIVVPVSVVTHVKYGTVL